MRFYRPEDISQDNAYKADFWDVYASNEQLTVDVADIIGKCSVTTPAAPGTSLPINPCCVGTVCMFIKALLCDDRKSRHKPQDMTGRQNLAFT